VPDFRCDLSARAVPLVHHWEYSLGSGHAALALRADWQQQLARCHRELGTAHVRFHGILSDNMGTLTGTDQNRTYSFFNADCAYDAILAIGMKPLVELSFMPSALASGSKTVFTYQGNVTPPVDPQAWDELVRRLLGHWLERYGRDAMVRWPIEVWNEPNLSAFWQATQQDYFSFYAHTARAVKDAFPELRVGGPVTAKGAWLEEFQAFLASSGAPCDFISTHYYPTDALGTATTDTEAQLAGSSRHAMREQVQKSRNQVYGRPLYFTEWNLSSSDHDELHDQPMGAAYLIKAIMEMNGLLDGSSWWTFSDIFAEQSFPYRPFHGGFGLLTLHGVPKPSYRAFQLLHDLGHHTLPVVGEHATLDCWCIRGHQRLDLLLTNVALPRHEICQEAVQVQLTHVARPARVLLRRIDENHANPRRSWITMGSPDQLSALQLEQLHGASALHEEELSWDWQDGTLTISLRIPANAVASITLNFTTQMTRLGAAPDSQAP